MCFIAMTTGYTFLRNGKKQHGASVWDFTRSSKSEMVIRPVSLCSCIGRYWPWWFLLITQPLVLAGAMGESVGTLDID